MKQIVIGIAVVVLYAMYSLGVRHEQPMLSKPSFVASAPATSSSSAVSTTPSSTTSQNSGQNTQTTPATATYKNGTYTGSVEDAFYGNVQVSASVSGGRLSNVVFLQYPNTHSTSVMINQQAMPWLTQEAIQKQNANVDIISGATFTSQAFIQSLTNALNQAHSA